MTESFKFLPRHQIDTDAWDSCVYHSRQSILYGYSWYLDAVLPAPDWKWIGLILLDDAGQYRAVMPIPLRRKRILSVHYSWVVHQPFFCQFLGVFTADERLESAFFFQAMQQEFRYGSVMNVRLQPGELIPSGTFRTTATQILDLSVGYDAIRKNYTCDRKQNLKRALCCNWTIINSLDPEPLLWLFRGNHATGIDGGVADWAYRVFSNLVAALIERNLITLRYAYSNGKPEAGALFVCEGNRIIYLFNAASDIGRRGNARTLLIDQMIQERAGESLVVDFESPDKPSIRSFYQSFGTSDEPFCQLRWNRLNPVEMVLRAGWNQLRKRAD